MLRRKYILFCLGGMFYRYLLGPFVSLHLLVLLFLLSFCLFDLSIDERGVLKSPTIRVWGLMYALNSSNVSFTYVGAFILGA